MLANIARLGTPPETCTNPGGCRSSAWARSPSRRGAADEAYARTRRRSPRTRTGSRMPRACSSIHSPWIPNSVPAPTICGSRSATGCSRPGSSPRWPPCCARTTRGGCARPRCSGDALARGGDLAGAVEALRREPAVRLQLGHVLAAARRPAAALAAYDAAPETPGIQLYRADVLLQLGHLHRAKTDLDRAEPGAAVSYTRGRLALADDDPATARTHFSAALSRIRASVRPGSASAWPANSTATSSRRRAGLRGLPRHHPRGVPAARGDRRPDRHRRGRGAARHGRRPLPARTPARAHLRQYDAAVARWNTLGTAPEALAVLTAARADRLARAAFGGRHARPAPTGRRPATRYPANPPTRSPSPKRTSATSPVRRNPMPRP
ncbi:hypothetical protein ACU686_39985 [Yinghuangia aomiensis]